MVKSLEGKYICSSLALLGMLLSSSYETIRVRPPVQRHINDFLSAHFEKIHSAMSSEESITADPESKYSQSALFHSNETNKKETESIKALLIRSVPFRTRPFLSRFDSAILYTMYTMYNCVGTVRTVLFNFQQESLRVNQTGLSRALSLSLVGLGDD